MTNKVSVDTVKLQKIHNALIDFDTSMSSVAVKMLHYLNHVKLESESYLKRKLAKFEENDARRKYNERTAEEENFEEIREWNRRQRNKEIDELNYLKKQIKDFSKVGNELIHCFQRMTSVQSENISKSSATINKCIQIIEEYYNVSLSNGTVGSTSANTNSSVVTQNKSGVNGIRDVREYSANWIDSLSEEEKRAINDYTREVPPYYKNINGVLRGKENHFEYGNEERNELLHKALSNANLPNNITVYRGGSSSVLGNLATVADSELIGKTFLDRGYVSTSMSPNTAFRGDVLMVINVPTGSHAACIEELSAAGSYEQELLIDRGQLFSISGVHRDQHNRRIIEVNLIN